MFEDIDIDLNYLTDHLKQLGDPSERIGPVIVTYALTTIHAKFETAIKTAIKERCKIEDPAVNSYVAGTIDGSVRSIKLDELKGILGKFGPEFKESFRKHHEESETAFQFYSNLETNRQSVAHAGRLEATMNDVVKWFSEAKTVIFNFRQVLGLSHQH